MAASNVSTSHSYTEARASSRMFFEEGRDANKRSRTSLDVGLGLAEAVGNLVSGPKLLRDAEDLEDGASMEWMLLGRVRMDGNTTSSSLGQVLGRDVGVRGTASGMEKEEDAEVKEDLAEGADTASSLPPPS